MTSRTDCGSNSSGFADAGAAFLGVSARSSLGLELTQNNILSAQNERFPGVRAPLHGGDDALDGAGGGQGHHDDTRNSLTCGRGIRKSPAPRGQRHDTRSQQEICGHRRRRFGMALFFAATVHG